MRIFRRRQRDEARAWLNALNEIIALELLVEVTGLSEDMERWSEAKMALDVKGLADFMLERV